MSRRTVILGSLLAGLAFSFTAMPQAALRQQAGESAVVFERISTGVVGTADRIVVAETGVLSGTLCDTFQQPGAVTGSLSAGKVRKLHKLVAQADRVKTSITLDTRGSFTYQLVYRSALLQWPQGAGPRQIAKLESFVDGVLQSAIEQSGRTSSCATASVSSNAATAQPRSIARPARPGTATQVDASTTPAQIEQRWVYQCLDRDGDGFGSADTCVFASQSSNRTFSQVAYQRGTRAAANLRYVTNSLDCNDYTKHLAAQCPSVAAAEIGYYQGLAFLLRAFPHDVTVRSLERYEGLYEELLRRAVIPMLAADYYAVGEAATRAAGALGPYEARSNRARNTTLATYCRTTPTRCPTTIENIRASARTEFQRGEAQRFSKPFEQITLREYCLATSGACRYPYDALSPEDYAADAVEWMMRHGGVPMFLAVLGLDRVGNATGTLGACSFGMGSLGLGSTLDKAEFVAGSNSFLPSLPSGLSVGADSIVGGLNQLATNASNPLSSSSCSTSPGATLLSRLEDPSLYGYGSAGEVLGSFTPSIAQGRQNASRHESLAAVYHTSAHSIGVGVLGTGLVRPETQGTMAGRVLQGIGLAQEGQGWLHDEGASKWNNDVNQATDLLDAYNALDAATADANNAQMAYDESRTRYDDLGCANANQSSAACEQATTDVMKTEAELAAAQQKQMDAAAAAKMREDAATEEAKKMAEFCRQNPNDAGCKDQPSSGTNNQYCPPDSFEACCDAVGFPGSGGTGIGNSCAAAAERARQELIEMFEWRKQPGAVDPSPIQDEDAGYTVLRPEDIEPFINWGEFQNSARLPTDRCIDPWVNPERGFVPPDQVGGYSACLSGSSGSATPSTSNCVGNLFSGVPGAAIGGMSQLLGQCPVE